MITFVGPVAVENFMEGRQGHALMFGGPSAPAYIVMHTIGIHGTGGSLATATSRFRNPASQESAHYGVGLDGSVVEWVKETDTAYHAGNLQMNLRSIGIEHEDTGDINGPRTDAVYAASSRLVKDLCQRYQIPINRSWIIEHGEVPGVTTVCPGSLDVDRIVAMASGAGSTAGKGVGMTANTEMGNSTNPGGVDPPPPGDPLRDIATKVYGDPNRWQDIYKSIQGVVSDATAVLQLEKTATAEQAPPAAPNGSPPDGAAASGTAQRRTPPQSQKEWGGSPGAIFFLQMLYLAVLAGLGVIYFTNRSLINLPDTLGPLPIAVPWFGALGAVLISMVGITEHRADWDPSYRFWHWVRPFLGASFGSISVLIFQAGILAVGTQPTGSNANLPKDLLYYLIAFVVGYREETFRELIKRITDIIFTPGTTANAVTVNSMSPLKGPAAGGNTVSIVGSGLSDIDSVRFGATPATSFMKDGDGQLTVVTPAGTGTVNVVVTAKSGNAIAGSFTYV